MLTLPPTRVQVVAILAAGDKLPFTVEAMKLDLPELQVKRGTGWGDGSLLLVKWGVNKGCSHGSCGRYGRRGWQRVQLCLWPGLAHE